MNRSDRSSRRVSVVLASTSPRRQEMLSELGIPFRNCSPHVAENWLGGHDSKSVAVEIATRKARFCADSNPEDLVIGMDTVVVQNGHILGKPRDGSDAAEMLKRLSNRVHEVITGTALIYGGQIASDAESTRVHFRRITDEEIHWYVRSGEPMDKAGAYGIQGLGRIFVEKVEGCFFNVVGFPISCFQRLLKTYGFSITDLM